MHQDETAHSSTPRGNSRPRDIKNKQQDQDSSRLHQGVICRTTKGVRLSMTVSRGVTSLLHQKSPRHRMSRLVCAMRPATCWPHISLLATAAGWTAVRHAAPIGQLRLAPPTVLPSVPGLFTAHSRPNRHPGQNSPG
jgi:hypothetical protein